YSAKAHDGVIEHLSAWRGHFARTHESRRRIPETCRTCQQDRPYRGARHGEGRARAIRRFRMSDLRPGLSGGEDVAQEIRASPAIRLPAFPVDCRASQRGTGRRSGRGGGRPAQILANARPVVSEPVPPQAKRLAPLCRATRVGPGAFRLRAVRPGLPATGKRACGLRQAQRRAQHAGFFRQRPSGRCLVRTRPSPRRNSRKVARIVAQGICARDAASGGSQRAPFRCDFGTVRSSRTNMTNTAIAFESIGSLADRIGSGRLSPVTVAEELLQRIEAIDGRLRSFIRVTPERALAQARAAESALKGGAALGILHGIPYAAKDLFDVKGFPMTAGTRLLAKRIAAQDSTAVHKLESAGMVLLGKTHTVQFAYGAPGINHDHGTPHNPWHPVPHAPGGSSSGSAVAVASGLVPMALGTDTGGSVRVPAALCGIVGLKTTVGRISRAGVYPLSGTLDSVGPITRSVEDAALVYQALQGSDPRDESTAG